MQNICPNCKRVTCEGCEDEDKKKPYFTGYKPSSHYLRKKDKTPDDYKKMIREILTKEG